MDTIPQRSEPASLLDRIPFGILVADAHGRATMANAAWCSLTEQGPGSWQDRGWMRAGPTTGLVDVLASRQPYAADWEVTTSSGAPRILHVEFTPDDEQGGVVVSAVDVTDERQRTSKLLEQATHDQLTGLVNRPQFIEFVGHALERHRREGSMLTAVLFIDVDDFKATNDALGHQAGDQLLRELASHLSAAVRPADIVARYGGDEFTVLCEDLGGADEAHTIAERVRRTAGSLSGHHRRASLSVGYVLIEDPSLEPMAVIDVADRMMYLDKQSRCGTGTPRSTDARPPAHIDLVDKADANSAAQTSTASVHP